MGPPPKQIEDSDSAPPGDVMNYMVGTFESNDGTFHDVFLHEAEWCLGNKKPIPKGMLVAHKDGNTQNNNILNLYLVPENKEHGDLHMDKVFHEDSLNVNLIKIHFSDIAQALGL